MTRRCLKGLSAHIIKSGETIYSIALKYKTSVKMILANNPNIDPKQLSAGDAVCVPQHENFPECNGGMYYYIQEGDNLQSIANTFLYPIEYILLHNPTINPSRLRIGQGVKVPVNDPYPSCPNGSFPYKVQPEDNIYSLAEVFHVPIKSLLLFNRHLKDRLIVGQTIFIPSKWKYYIDQIHQVSFMYPSLWKRAKQEPNGHIRYEGREGYFEITNINVDESRKTNMRIPFEKVCKDHVYSNNCPYGTTPSITRTKLNGDRAYLILPSNDQSAVYNGKAAIIIALSNPHKIAGETHRFILITAHKNYINGIASTLKVLDKAKKFVPTHSGKLEKAIF